MFLARFFLKNVISTKRRVFALGTGCGCPVPGRAALCRRSLSSVCPRSPWVVFYFCGFQQLLGDPIPRDGSKDASPHPDGCWELAAALLLNHPRGAAEKMPCLGPGACSGGGRHFPTRAWGPRGAGAQPRSCVPLRPVPAPCPPFPLPFSYFIYFFRCGQ